MESTLELLTSSACAARLGVHRSTITRWVRNGTLPAWRIGGVLRVDWSDVLSLVNVKGP